MRILVVLLFAVLTLPSAVTQQNQDTTPESAKQAASKKDKGKKEPTPGSPTTPDKSAESGKPAEPSKAGASEGTDKEEHYDVAEVPPVITHHQTALNGKTLSYTATTGRLPIKRGDGKTEAEMFFVAYTLDGQEAAKRPLTFSFNGGPGSASIWLHMGALGPRRVALPADGFQPPPPYKMEDNPYSLLDKSDL